MNKIWFTSDTHYHHKNICYGVSEWKNREASTRIFDTLEKMNHAIVDSINSHVEYNDILYMLGDWSFGGIENIWKFRSQLVCENIHLILGNHDHHINKNKVLPHDNVTHAQDLFSSVQNYLEIEINNQIFILFHYPIEEWHEMDRRGSIMLHGHCHHSLDNSDTNLFHKRMDVGIDWKEFRPYSLEEILKIMNKRKLKIHQNSL